MAVLPKGVLALRHVAAQAPTRFAMQGVRIERKDDKLVATATDGKRLARVVLDDKSEREQFPETGLDHKPASGFATILPVDALANAEKTMPRGVKFTKFQALALEEPTANGTVNLATTDGKSVTKASVPSLEGTYPDVNSVIPPADQSYGTIRLGLDAELLYGLAVALRAAVGRDPKRPPVVILEIQDGVSPIRVLVSEGTQQGLGAVAPVTIDPAQTVAPDRAVGLVMPVNVA